MTKTVWRLIRVEEGDEERAALNVAEEKLCFLIVKAFQDREGV